jgi:multidrug efflux pump subunit AcrB
MYDLDTGAMQSLGLTGQDIANALAAQNILTPAGTEKVGQYEYTVSLNSAPSKIAELAELPIKSVRGAMVYMHDVAHVHNGNAVQTLFDGGLRRARVAQARAEFDSSAANYRGIVVAAFQQVEDDLANLNHYHEAARDERAVVRAAQRSLDFAMALYTQGATDYLTVVTSQTSLLQAQLGVLSFETLQLRASVDLIRALGGGWEDSSQQVAAR